MEELDRALVHLLYAHADRNPWIWLMIAASAIGGGIGAALLVPGLVVARRSRRLGIFLGATLVANGIVVQILKRVIGRERPCRALAAEGISAVFFKMPTDGSFPSGHAATSAALSTFLTVALLSSQTAGSMFERVRRAPIVIAFVAFALSVGVSRIVLGCHYPSDVLVGWALGIAFGAVGARLWARPRLGAA